jgi:hypothetical protein
MSRRDRRAALARGKAEPAAEVLCRQILALDARQPTALNIVGLLYQASGNDRLAAKTLAKAVGANELKVRVTLVDVESLKAYYAGLPVSEGAIKERAKWFPTGQIALEFWRVVADEAVPNQAR